MDRGAGCIDMKCMHMNKSGKDTWGTYVIFKMFVYKNASLPLVYEERERERGRERKLE